MRENKCGFRQIDDFVLKEGDYDSRIWFGPQHPTHKEPIRFIFGIKGETIQQVSVRIGFNFRGIEKALEQRTWIQNLYLIERICGICSNAHQSTYCLAVERAWKKKDEIPERATVIRMIFHELERIHSHMLWIGVCAHDAGYDTAFHLMWRDREAVMDVLEMISGNRVNYSMLTIGGVRRDISNEQAKKCVVKLKLLKKRVEHYKKVMEVERTFLARLKDVAILTRETALKYCTVGPTARASGIPIDIRKNDPYMGYKSCDFNVFTRKNGDLFDTFIIRFEETIESIRITVDLLENLPQGDIAINFNQRIQGPAMGLQRIEAPRGEDIHFTMVGEGKARKPYRHKIRAPTLANLPSLTYRLLDQYVADVPVVIRSIDPCIGCMERVTFVDLKTGRKREIEGRRLISKANRAYRQGTRVLDL